MNYFLLIICLLLAIMASLCQAGEASFKDAVARCSKIVIDLNIQGTEAYIPTKEEAKAALKDLGKLFKIEKISNAEKRKKKLDKRPDLQLMAQKLKAVKGLEQLPDPDIENVLKKDQQLLETVVKLSFLDTKNKRSPVFNMNLDNLLGIVKRKKKNRMKAKYHNREGAMRLVYSITVPPGGSLPDPRIVKFTDRKGRKCACQC